MTAQLASADISTAITAPDPVRRLLKRARVDAKIEILRGNIVVGTTQSLGGLRNVEWAQDVVSEATQKVEGGLFVITVDGEHEATWDTSWRDESAADGGSLNTKYETFGSRMQAFGFACLREAKAANEHTAAMLQDAGKILREQGEANAKQFKAMQKTIRDNTGDSDAVAIARMEADQEESRMETALEMFGDFTTTNKEVTKGGAKPAGKMSIPAIVADILEKVPEEDRAVLLATDAGKALKEATTAQQLMKSVREIHAMHQNGAIEISDDTAKGVAHLLMKLGKAVKK